jgi:hypothetical protein
MKLIYLSTDELNRALVRSWAGQKGIPVECPTRADPTLADPHASVLIDVDHLPPAWLEGFLERLGAAGEAPSVAAHGYGTSGDVLRRRGLIVHSRLRARVLADLASAAMSPDCAPARDASEALTWIDLV